MKALQAFAETLYCALILLAAPALAAQPSPTGPPPAVVVTQKAISGKVVPVTQFIGTVFFNEDALVSTEISGIVKSYHFATGQRVKKGQVLVHLDTALLQEELESARALKEQAETTLEDARKEFKRMKALHTSGSISEQDYDKALYLMRGLEKKVISQKSTMKKIQLQIDKATIRAPFSGIIIERAVDRGEWLNRGDLVAEIARTDIMDVKINVPQRVYLTIKTNQTYTIDVAGRKLEGTVYAKVAKGDVSSRTFPILLKVQNPGHLAQGMEAVADLPTGPEIQAILVPRDAIISVFGTLSIFAVKDGKALMLPVTVFGYTGNSAGVDAPGLAPGMDVVIKGNERLRAGQPVAPSNQCDTLQKRC